MKIAEETVNVILHVVILATFINVFFFTYGSYLEEQIIEQQLGNITHNIARNVRILNPDILTGLAPYVNGITPPDMSAEDAAVKARNGALKVNAVIAMTTFAIVAFIVCGGIMYKYDVDYKKILLNNGLSLLFVGLTYFLFSSFVIANYISVDENFVIGSILTSMKKRA